jgi:hypothetical protein
MVITHIGDGQYKATHKSEEAFGYSHVEAMMKLLALQELKSMTEDKFQTFFESLPERVKMLVRGGMTKWESVLPAWYLKQA